jgi:serine/threonine-protein kinase
VAQALHICNSIGVACHELHEQGLVHADLKPANILLCRAQEKRLNIKIIDLGSALQEGSKPAAPAVGGSAAFMSPEHARGLTLDRRSDVYSVGALLFLILTGENLYGSNESKTILLQLQKGVPGERIVNAKIPNALQQIILKACAEDPAKRFASMPELCVAMQLI